MMLETGALAPPFTLLSTAGREYSVLASVPRDPLLLVFFKVGCAACDLTFPYLIRLRESYGAGWQIWAVAQEPPDRAAQYAARFRLNFPVLIDGPGYEVSRSYDPPATPTMFLIGPDGRTVFDSYGFSKDDVNEIARRLSAHLGVEPVEVARSDDGQPAFKPG
jgi:peroxiredoxin